MVFSQPNFPVQDPVIPKILPSRDLTHPRPCEGPLRGDTTCSWITQAEVSQLGLKTTRLADRVGLSRYLFTSNKRI